MSDNVQPTDRKRPCLHFKAEARENRPVNEKHYLLTFRPLTETPEPRPGQFYMIGVSNSHDPLLKRPFCFFKKADDSVQILYRVRGKGTALMKEMKTGDVFDVIGPLGNTWPLPSKKHIPLIVTGGIGIASVFPLAKTIKGRPYVFYGAKSKDELLMLDELGPLARELHTSTEDGSYGTKGTVTEAVTAFLNDRPDAGYILYACGPRGMLEAVSEIASHRGLKGYVSVEENMACGVGACLGCAVKTTKGYKRVCKEGPVFKIGDILL